MATQRRDWRWWLSGIGRVLIVTGLLLLGFVAYQLWGTGIQTARAQRSLSNEFDEFLAQAEPPPTTAATTTTTTEPEPTIVLPPSQTLPVPGLSTSSPPAPTTTSVPTTTAAPPVVDAGLVPAGTGPVAGDPVLRLEIPRLGLSKIVVSGVDTSSLRKGPGHYPATAFPGEVGNAGIAGHRTTYGAPFERLDRLEPGDEIITTTPAGRFVYRVTGTQIVQPEDSYVLADTGRAVLTLTTCHPRFSTAERLVVAADIDEAASDALLAPGLTAGWYGEGGGPPVVATTVPATTSAPEPTGTTTAPNVSVEPVTTSAAAAVTTAVTAPIAPGGAEAAEVADAFGAGWFSDSGAWPHVAAWGTLLTLVGLGAWGIGRWTKRSWLGGLAAVAPLVVVLYFFYENVARLLPPNL